MIALRILSVVCALCLVAVAAASLCDERKLERDAVMILSNHVDVELGGVGAGRSDVVGFQYLKPAEALLAAQALAHNDFNQAVTQVQRILEYQKPEGLLPHLIYGPSVLPNLRWIPSNRTFHPGPAFWKRTSSTSSQGEEKPTSTSSISAPPVAANVAWEIFRLAPYDSVLGGRTTGVQFLCRIYEPLKKIQRHLFSTRRDIASKNGLLTARHPWETFSSLSPHWKGFLAELKNSPDYKAVVDLIPEHARTRFAAGASTVFSAQDAVKNMYEPMIYLADQIRQDSGDIGNHGASLSGSNAYASHVREAVRFGVEDVEFNALMLRSSLSLLNIARVLAEHSSVCPITPRKLQNDLKELETVAKGLKEALIGSNSTPGLWNISADFFADSSRLSLTTVHSLRGFLPGYAVEVDDDKKIKLMKHFFSEPGSFSFFCGLFPMSFFACSGRDFTQSVHSTDSRPASTTWILYNYYIQRGFISSKFPGVADYIRNKTRDMICNTTAPNLPSLSWFPVSLTIDKSTPAALTPAYDSYNGSPVEVFDDSYMGSTLAAAALLNILLPAVTPLPSPDTPPIDHRILSVIMCVELVVAFGVAMSCFLFSVYFVANRPRHTRSHMAHRRSFSIAQGKKARHIMEPHRDGLEDRERSSANGSSCVERYSDSSYDDSGQAPNELEESLLYTADEQYGSFDEAPQPGTLSDSAWNAAKNALAAISPW